MESCCPKERGVEGCFVFHGLWGMSKTSSNSGSNSSRGSSRSNSSSGSGIITNNISIIHYLSLLLSLSLTVNELLQI